MIFKQRHILFIFVIVLASLCIWWFVFSVNKTKWSALTQKDLNAIYHILSTQTPGAIDTNNPQYAKWMNSGFKKTMKMAKQVKNSAGYYFALQYYLNGFHDAHLHLLNSEIKAKKLQYPGFIIRYSHNNFIVSKYGYSASNNIPPIGAKLINCDNQTPQGLMENNTFPFFGNIALQADWTKYTPFLLTNMNNPWIKLPSVCKFKIANQIISIKLRWIDIKTKRLYALLRKTAYSYSPKIGISKFAQNGIWIALGTFWPNDASQAKPLQKIVTQISKFRNSTPITFDLRGNSGGNFAWGKHILQNLFGTKYFQFISDKNQTDTYGEWRISKGNANFIKNYYMPLLAKTVGVKSKEYRAIVKLSSKMHMALLKNITLGRFNLEDEENNNNLSKKVTDPVSSNIFLLTDGRCMSSCMMFVDLAMQFPNVTIIGESTLADTYYTEVRVKQLPSKLSTLQFPMQVIRNRKRLSNQPYLPKYVFPGNINDTVAIKKWVLKNFGKWRNTATQR